MPNHIVTGLKEIIVKCGHCGEPWTQPVNPSERFSFIVCPHCTRAAATVVAFDLLDSYEMRGPADA